MPIGNKEELISVREAARQCGRHAETVRRWIWSGKLPAEKLGNQLFIKKSALGRYCREMATRPYQAERKLDFLERAIALQNRIKARGGKPIDAAEEIRKMREERTDELERRLAVIRKLKRLRERIRSRMGRDFTQEEITGTIEKMRQERMNELSGLR